METGIGAAIGTFLTTYGTAISAVAAVASTAYTMTQSPGGMDMPNSAPVVNVGDNANQIDKTSMQKDAELGKLQLGEDEMDKAKRKKGKAAFKVALSEEAKKKRDAGGEPATGVQVAKPEDVGAQL
jgi:hypothetical protein